VRRGLAASRTQAAELIESGSVLVGGAPAWKPSRLVDPGEPVAVTGPPPRFVSRGGEKLAAALERFGLRVSGLRALDAGASTGGFTDCLLKAGAASVRAVDVGRGQLHESLRSDGRVEVLERTDIRELETGVFDLVVADLSFISLRSVAAALVAQARPGADLVVLVKPQFEAGRKEASRGRGVIRDPAVWRRTLLEALVALEAAGATMMGVMVSPLHGADGNVEFLAHLRRADSGAGSGASSAVSLEAAVDSAVDTVGG
jgi:23S rRNA (cytidine1920-2'-O)/16S rRNA (cytidine1409-2'-O)-methyltransferase